MKNKKLEFPDWVYKSKATVLPNQLELPGTNENVRPLDDFFTEEKPPELDDFFKEEDTRTDLQKAKENWKRKGGIKSEPKSPKSIPYFSGMKTAKKVVETIEERDGEIYKRWEVYEDGTKKLVMHKIGNVKVS